MIQLPTQFLEDLSRATSIEDVLGTAASWLPRVLDADLSHITVVDDDRTVARSFRRDGTPDLNGAQATILPGSPRKKVLRNAQPMHLDRRALAVARDPAMQAFYAGDCQQVQLVPMTVASKSLGVLGLARRADVPFKWQQVRTMCAAANWIASQIQILQQLRENARLAETDALTGLANRVRLMRFLSAAGALEGVDAEGRVPAVLHVDLDRFKAINDRHGHAVGDAVLVHAARMMRDTVSPGDLVARLGGDEFVIVTRSDLKGREAGALAETLLDRLAAPFSVGDVSVTCPGSIGLALAGEPGMTADILIGNADLALYTVKGQGGGRLARFSDRMREREQARQAEVEAVTEALQSGAFEAVVQPVTDLATGKVVSGEMLARWQHPTKGSLPASAFLETLRDAGLIRQVDGLIRTEGLRLLQRLRSAGGPMPQISLNTSGATLSDPDLPESLLWDVLGRGLLPANVIVEVREADLHSDRSQAIESTIKRLTHLGFPVVVDDFGQGFASMQQMRRLQVRGIKLCQTLTAERDDPGNAAILRATLAMARELGLSVTVKSVERTDRLEQLKAMGCDLAQGMAVSAPLPAAAFARTLAPPAEADAEAAQPPSKASHAS